MVVSILLNFSQNIEFQKTDPLMGIVTACDKLLFYNSLSVGRFQYDKKDQFIQKKIANLRNVLENRSLSSEDREETIRLIVVLDFNVWDILDPHPEQDKDEATQSLLGLPALKVNYIKTKVEEIFGERNPLLKRLEYDFTFVHDDDERSPFFREVMYNGYGGDLIENSWISHGSLEVNGEKVPSNGQDRNLSLENNLVCNDYNRFQNKCVDVIDAVRRKLEPLGLEEKFNLSIDAKLKDVKTLGQHWDFDYDFALRSAVSEVVGLKATQNKDSVFFVIRVKKSPAALKCEDETKLKSLIQMLCTIDEEDHEKVFGRIVSSSTPKLFILCDTIKNKQVFAELRKNVVDFRAELNGFVWKDTLEVEYNEYELPDNESSDSHDEHNKEVNDIRQTQRQDFWRKSRIPFFFGKKEGDWNWYMRVLNALNKTFLFEMENNSPLHDNLTRVTDEELRSDLNKTTYGMLKERRDDLLKTDVRVESNVDFEEYITERKKNIKNLGSAIAKLKTEMVKLGFCSCLIWIALLSSLAFTLCYAYHFFYNEFEDSPIWIGAGFLAVALFFLVGSIWARGKVKSKIKGVYAEIRSVYEGIDKLQDEYLESVRELDRQMKEADAHRKTVAEVMEKIEEFDSHNKKVELWEAHFDGMVKSLDDIIDNLKIDEKPQSEKLSFDDKILGKYPVIPYSIWSQDIYMDTRPIVLITTNAMEKPIKKAVSFMQKYEFACEQE